MTSNNFNLVNNTCVLTGQAVFANGKQNYTITLTGSGLAWKVTSVQLQ